MPALPLYSSFLRTLREQEVASFLLVFLSVLAMLKANQYLFYHFTTSPAIILMPTGIGLAAAYLGGYRMWLPIACAWFLALLSGPSQSSLLFIIVATAAYTLQAVLGGYILNRYNFLGTMEHARCALIFVGTALVIPVVAPSIVTGVQWLTGSLSVTAWTSWSRAWAGSVMSIMVFTPLITTWVKHHTAKSPKEFVESILALSALILAIYLTFWTTLPQINTFLILYLLFAVLFWIGLRMHPRITALALFLTMALGMVGSIIAHPSAIPLNQQLLSDELFMILIAPIFFILVALVQERRGALETLTGHVGKLEVALNKISSEDKAKKEFLGILAHELRNPLATVLSSIELLKMQGIWAPNAPKILETIDDRARVMVRLLDDLLDITRISQKKLGLQKETVSLDRFIDKLEDTVQPLVRKYGHTLSITKPDQELFVDADSTRLEQIFMNLLTNAAKYTKSPGSIDLVVRRDGNMAMVHVRDSGVGIPKKMLKRIFEPFFQIDQSKDSGREGIGVGLPLTRQLVEMHDGTIEAISGGTNAGSEFIVRLPLSIHAQKTLSSALRVLHNRARTVRRVKHTRRILVVDDNETASESLARMLELRGHAVAVAYNGREALEKASQFKPEVVVLDIGLPDIDGYKVAAGLQRHKSPYFLIALTGYGQEEDKERARQAGFHYHLTKPAGFKEIEAVLRKYSRTMN